MTERMAKSSVYQSTTTPIPITMYKVTTPPAIAGYINTLKSIAAAIVRKAKILAATVLEALNVSGIRALMAKVMAIRNAVMNAVSAGIAWVQAAATGIKNLINDTVNGLRNLVTDLNNLVKMNPFYQLANKLCAGFDASGIAAQIASIQTRLDMDRIVDYILENNDSDMLKNIKNCQVFTSDSKDKLKAAVDKLFSSSNFMMLDAMADKVDYWDIANVDRKFREAASFMEDTDLNRQAIDEIRGYMFLSKNFMVMLKDPRFENIDIYKGDVIKDMNKNVPNYLTDVIGKDNRTLLAGAMNYM